MTKSFRFHLEPRAHDLESFILFISLSHFFPFGAVSSRPGVIYIIHIPEMFRFHHSSHLWVALTRHHEPESILIGYPFRAQSSRPRVVFHLWPRVISFPFKAQSSRPRVISSPFRAQSFRPRVVFHLWPRVISSPSRALSSRPRVVYPILNSKSFILSLTYIHSSHPWLVILFTSFPLCATRHIPLSLYCHSLPT